MSRSQSSRESQSRGAQTKGEPSAAEDAADATPKKTRKTNAAPSSHAPWKLRWRVIASLAVVFHLTAVFVAPWRLATPNALPPGYVPVDPEGRPRPDLPPPPPDHIDRDPPPLIDLVYRWLTPYMNLAFINHGYEFFAPNPGATHLIKIWAFDAQGQQLREEEIYPDLKKQRPRLYYHRHMMLAEQAFDLGPNALQSYGVYLLRKYGASRVRLEYAVHQLLAPRQVLAGDPLDASFTYKNIDTVEVDATGIGPPPRLQPSERLPGVSP